jgi:hypothetical protein
MTIKNEKSDVKIAIEYCRSNNQKTFAIGGAKSMIDSRRLADRSTAKTSKKLCRL